MVCALLILLSGSTAAARAQTASGLIELGDRRMYLNCAGTGPPTVVLEADLLASSADWQAVQQRLSSEMQVCSYDRVGRGQSDGRAPSDRPLEDLRVLLAAGGVRAPYVLVGNGFGALLTQLYARQYPQDVSALVLVDPDDEQLAARYQSLATERYHGSYRRWMREDPDGRAVATAFTDLRAAPALQKMPLLVLAHEDLDVYKRLAASVPGGRLQVINGLGLQLPRREPQRVSDAIASMSNPVVSAAPPWVPLLPVIAGAGALLVLVWRRRAPRSQDPSSGHLIGKLARR